MGQKNDINTKCGQNISKTNGNTTFLHKLFILAKLLKNRFRDIEMYIKNWVLPFSFLPRKIPFLFITISSQKDQF